MGNASERSDPAEAPSWMKSASQRLENAVAPPVAEEACAKSGSDPCEDSKDVIAAAFTFMQGPAMAELEKLATDLKKVDKPNWQEELLEHCLDAALLVGGARAGAYLAGKLGKEFAESAGGEFIKKFIEEGAPKGTKAALAKLGGNENPDVDEFILAQKLGVCAMYQDASVNFLREGRHKLTTTREATQLAKALSSSHLTTAAQHQYVASRDAYLSALARGTAGTRGGPRLEFAQLGMDKGVLEVQVFLGSDVTSEPHVFASYLNGINETIQEQYEDKPLNTLRIPRHLVCSVRGDMSDFTVTVDESGGMQLVRGDGEWLEARARAAQPNLSERSKAEQHRIGLDLLLADLRVQKIGKGAF